MWIFIKPFKIRFFFQVSGRVLEGLESGRIFCLSTLGVNDLFFSQIYHIAAYGLQLRIFLVTCLFQEIYIQRRGGINRKTEACFLRYISWLVFSYP